MLGCGKIYHSRPQEKFWTYVVWSYLCNFWPWKVKIGIKMCQRKVRFFEILLCQKAIVYYLLCNIYVIKNLRQSLVLNHFYLFLTMWLLLGRRQWLHWEWHGGAQWCGPVRQVLTWSCRQRFQAKWFYTVSTAEGQSKMYTKPAEALNDCGCPLTYPYISACITWNKDSNEDRAFAVAKFDPS